MPFELKLTKKLKAAGWKVKIRDKEKVEPPHVTILRGPETWRLGLRDSQFLLPEGGSWKDFPSNLQKVLKNKELISVLKREWDRMYPTNPVGGTDD